MKMIRENSRFRIGWDLLILVLVIASCLLIPFQIALQHVIDWRAAEIVYLVDLCFLIDIFLNFFTSYRHKGTEITDRKKTSARYLKTLFVIDDVPRNPGLQRPPGIDTARSAPFADCANVCNLPSLGDAKLEQFRLPSDCQIFCGCIAVHPLDCLCLVPGGLYK
jgi:hypothetical protein